MRLSWVLASALLVIGALRLFLVVTHAPLAGYANQYDMIRTSACVGYWPTQDGAREAAHPQSPIARYVAGTRDVEACVPSAEVAWVAVVAHGGTLDLRVVGVTQALALLIVALWLHVRVRAMPGAQLMHAAVFALVLCDPFDTLWLNTLYTELPALFGAYLATAGLVVAATEPRPTRGGALAFALGIALLGASRVQHLLLPFVWLAVLALVLRRRGVRHRALLASSFAIALATFAGQVAVQRMHPALAPANRSDALFGALMPAAADPVGWTEKLGLPANCAELAHTTWYLRRGRDAQAECPAAFALSSARIVAALGPRQLATALARGLVLSTAWRLPYVGEVAGADTLRLDHPSVADLIAPLSLGATLALWLTPLFAGAVAALRLLFALRRRDSALLLVDALLALAALVIGAVWLASVLGDGYSETARHLHLAQNFVLVAWALLLGAAVHWRIWTYAGFAVFAIGLALAHAGARLPLAFGALTQPATDPADAGAIDLAGLALDARGVARIEARLDGAAPVPLDLAPSAAIARQFPIARGDAGREFRGRIDYDGTPRRLAIVVVGADGVETVVDRRWLR